MGAGAGAAALKEPGEGDPGRPVPLDQAVAAVLAATGPGDVLTYGEVAAEAGRPGAARAVGRILSRSEGLPWWRVVTASGRLVPGHEDEHARRLLAEGVRLDGGRVATTRTSRPGGGPRRR